MTTEFKGVRRGALALALLSIMSGPAGAAVTLAYDLNGNLGQSWNYSLAFNITGPDAVSIDIQTSYFPGVPSLMKMFETDGVGGTLTLTETITNNGTTAWSGWSEAMWDDSNFYSPGNPGNLSWTFVSSSVAGSSSINSGLGTLDFNFATALQGGQSFTLTKSIDYVDGTYAIGVAEAPAPVPVPAALPLLLSGLAGLSFMGRNKGSGRSE